MGETAEATNRRTQLQGIDRESSGVLSQRVSYVMPTPFISLNKAGSSVQCGRQDSATAVRMQR